VIPVMFSLKKSRFSIACIAAAIMLSGSVRDVPAQSAGIFSRVDKIFKQWDTADSPGCSIAIIRDGKIIYAHGYGMANLDYTIPNTPETVFRIGSTSKQFTAACIQILHARGRLSLDDDIREYFPEMPEYEWRVTVRHLIYHTSGIRDYLTLQYLAGVDDEANSSPEDVVELLSRQKELNFKPGDEFLYSNSGYLLLGEIVRRVSGKTLAQFAKENIFDPLGMKNTHFHYDNTVIVRNRATGYAAAKNGFRVNETINECVGDGAVFTTVEDLFLWDQNFYENTLDIPGLMRSLEQTGVLNDGANLKYAYGLNVRKYRGLRMVSHGGSFVGFRADMVRFPEKRFTVICLANLSSINPSSLCLKAADLFLTDFYTEEEKKPEGREKPVQDVRTAIVLSPEQLNEYAGDYFSDELLVTYKLRMVDGRLRFTHKNAPSVLPLKAQNRDAFSVSRLQFEFKRDAHGKISGFTIQTGRVKNILFKKR